MIDLSKYRVIDLSHEVVPGERRIDGRYLHGEPMWGRPVEVQEFIAYNARMHFIQGQTHTGTHVEAPYKYIADGADVGAMPVTSYLGEAAFCDFSHKKAGEAITAEEFRQAGVGKGDIVLIRSSAELLSGQYPYIAVEALDWLIQTGIKLLGSGGNMLYGPPDGELKNHIEAEKKLLRAGIATADALCGLDQIRKQRVFFIALPVKLRRVTASWTRAIALEALD